MDDPREGIDITPRCMSGEQIFISSEGWLLPCCYSHIYLRNSLANPERHGEMDLWFARNLDLFDLKRRTPAEILADPRWQELARSWTDGTAPRVCTKHCGVPRGSGYGHVNEIRARDRTPVVFSGKKPA